MARRLTWTNNSTSYDGTEAYRDTTIDPQNLPEPIATVDPVAQGATVEYVDTDELNGTYCYAVRDYDSVSVSDLSSDVCIQIGDDYDSTEIGDPIGGGYYAGIYNGLHVVVAEKSAESGAIKWKTSRTETAGADDLDDGAANTADMIAASAADHPAADYCNSYTDGEHNDWHLASKNQMNHLFQTLDPDNAETPAIFQAGGGQEFDNDPGFYWTSTERDATRAWIQRWSDGYQDYNGYKDLDNVSGSPFQARPIRVVQA